MVIDMAQHLLTTVDNPWNPFTNYDEWYTFDHDKGYDTPGLLARIANVSLELSDADLELSIDQAMDEIVQQNVNGLYVKVSEPVKT